MLQFMTVGAVLTSLIAAPLAAPTTVRPRTKITIDVVTVNGSGCRPGTAMVAPSADNTAFTVSYSEYTAKAGPGVNPTDRRKNCLLGLRLRVPQGFTYAVAQADYRGYALLERGATALQQANYYFQGESPTQYVPHGLRGPRDGNWQFTDHTAAAHMVFAPCGVNRNLNVNTELRVNAGSSRKTSFISMDSTDGSVKTIYRLAWRRC